MDYFCVLKISFICGTGRWWACLFLLSFTRKKLTVCQLYSLFPLFLFFLFSFFNLLAHEFGNWLRLDLQKEDVFKPADSCWRIESTGPWTTKMLCGSPVTFPRFCSFCSLYWLVVKPFRPYKRPWPASLGAGRKAELLSLPPTWQ